MGNEWRIVKGILVPGHRVASGKSEHYPAGTIEIQTPYFEKLGLDISEFHSATLNISIAPLQMKVVRPEYTFKSVRWTSAHPPEDFSFSRCRVRYAGSEYTGLIYYPHPETKERHFQNPSLIEVLAPFIPDLEYGSELELLINAGEISITGD